MFYLNTKPMLKKNVGETKQRWLNCNQYNLAKKFF